MAGETILVADDQPVRLRLTQAFLGNEGYKIITAQTSVEAAQALEKTSPDLIFANLELVEGSSLELVRRLRRRPELEQVLTLAAIRAGDDAKAVEVGCNAALARPVAMSALGARIRELFDRRTAPPPAPPAPEPQPEPVKPTYSGPSLEATAELDLLRARFLAEGNAKLREMIQQLDTRFDIKAGSRTVHQWIGTGGLLGYAAISRLAREAEDILSEHPFDGVQLAETLDQLRAAFSSPREAAEQPLPASIVEALARKRVAAIEPTPYQQERLNAALDRVRATLICLGAEDPPECELAASADLLIVNVNAMTIASPWLDPSGLLQGQRPIVFMGMRDDLAALPQEIQAVAREFLMDGWLPDEALVRLSLAAAHRPETKVKPALNLGVHSQVVIADDDPAVLALVRTALENFGMDCHTATNGAEAIAAIRTLHPHAAVLDVNMPSLDGYEVLAAVRHQGLPVRVLLLTARQQESDVIRGFTLGADDYVVKPFSPMELVARLKRLLMR